MLIVIPGLVILAIGALIVFAFEAMTGELRPKKKIIVKEEVIYRRDEEENDSENKTAA